MTDLWTAEVLLDGTFYSSSCTLLTRASHRIVIDTGLSLREGELVAALAARGLTPGDIDLVVNTHLHVDHCGNNALFSRADIYMSEAEWRWTDAFYTAIFDSRTPERVAPRFYPELPSYDFKPRTIRNVAKMAKLFWKPERLGPRDRFRWLESSPLPAGLEVLQTPGHTPYHISLRVAGSDPLIVAGDAVLAEDAEAKVKTMIPHSRARFLATRRALLERGERIVAGHGGAFLPHPIGASLG